MPVSFSGHFEPFFGGGALFFDLLPAEATINDVNTDLLAIYMSLRNENDFISLLSELRQHENSHSEEYYYKVRQQDRQSGFSDFPIWKRAARTIYLNKACYNGLYRVNSKGFFNVPFGKKEHVQTFDPENIQFLHDFFMHNDITILNGDFENAVITAKKGDFVYFDPPYDPIANKNSFTAYSEGDFSENDQVRLANTFSKLDELGVFVMLSNHNTPLIQKLYKKYNITVINAKRMINSDAKKRGNVEEVIVTNY